MFLATMSRALGVTALLMATTRAQTFTECDPTKKTCPNDPALGMHHDFVFNASSVVTDAFNVTAGSLDYGADGAEFTISKQGESPTIISKFYIFFGSVSVLMKTAKGTGIISSIVLLSNDLDEVDWEFMGGNGTHGMTSFDRARYHPIPTDPRVDFHNYTFDWTQERINWMIDGQVVRTLPYGDANGGHNYPQTPCTVRLGIWAGGDESMPQGTIDWAGGRTTYKDTPYTMSVKSASVTDYSTGKEYQWTDRSGSWQSIKAIQGNSTVAHDIVEGANRQPSKSLSEKFNALPQTTKTAIFASSGAAGAILLAAFLFFCCRKRRAGRREREEYNALVEQQRQDNYREQMELRANGKSGMSDSAVPAVPAVPSLPSLPPSPAVVNEKAAYFDQTHAVPMGAPGSNGYAAVPPRTPQSAGFNQYNAPHRAMTASPMERSMSPPILVPVPGQRPYAGPGYAHRGASPSVGMQSPRSYHPV